MGDGEVIDGHPPPPTKKRKYNDTPSVEGPAWMFKDKGKNKVFEHFSFNDNGVLSQKAVRALDKGQLSNYSPEFGKQVINLNAVAGIGIYARDILHHALLGSLRTIIPKLYVSNPIRVSDEMENLMSVDEVLALFGFDSGEASSSKGPV